MDLPDRGERLHAGSDARGANGVARRAASGSIHIARGDAVGFRSGIQRSRASRSTGESDRATAGELPPAHRGALPPGDHVRRSRRRAGAAAWYNQDTTAPREAATAAAARDRAVATIMADGS